MQELIRDRIFRVIIITFICAIIFVMITLKFWIEISLFSIGMLKAVCGIILFWLFDKYGLKDIDTIAELKKGNIAYAIMLLSYAILIASAIISS